MILYLDSSPIHFASVYSKDVEVSPTSNRTNVNWNSEGMSCLYFRKAYTNLKKILEVNGDNTWLPTPNIQHGELGTITPDANNTGFVYSITHENEIVFSKTVTCNLIKQ